MTGRSSLISKFAKPFISLRHFLGRVGIINLSLTLIATFLVAVSTAPVANSYAANSCGYQDGVGFSNTNITITPLQGRAFYVDPKNKIDATYIGYKISNTSASSIQGLWIELRDFRNATTPATPSVLRLANPSDSLQPVGDLAGNSSTYVYFLINATALSAETQAHDVRIYNSFPTASSSTTRTCYFTFDKVIRVLAASANKVTSVTLTGTPKVGNTISIAISGQTGQSGSGSASPDGDIMWISGASTSSWPTTALRLESVTTSVKCKKSGSTDTYANKLLIDNISVACPGNKPFTSATTYTSTFVFRVLGGATSDPVITPVANISSGTQIKHTGAYPNPTTVPLTSVSLTATAVKSIPAGQTYTRVTGVSISKSATYYREVQYKILLSDTVASSVDKIIDDPDSDMFYKAGSVRVTDATRTAATMTEPTKIGTATDEKNVFPGPFKLSGSGTSYSAFITFTMYVKVPAVDTTFSNLGYAYVGSTLVGGTTVIGNIISGNSTTKISQAQILMKPDPTDPVIVVDPPSVDPPKQDQTIDFPQVPAMAVNSTYTLQAVASSGLAVSYSVNNPANCSVSGGVLTAKIESSLCEVTASQAGNGSWNAATPVTVTVTIKKAQVISFAPAATMLTGASQTVSGSASSGLSVTYTSLTPDICTFASAATTTTKASNVSFTIVATSNGGSCVITADQAGDATYGPAPTLEAKIAVGSSQTITFTQPANQASSGTTFSITASSSGSTNSKTLGITFTVTTPSVCQMTGDPTYGNSSPWTTTQSIQTLALGLCTVVASQDGFDTTGGTTTVAPATDVSRSFTVGLSLIHI